MEDHIYPRRALPDCKRCCALASWLCEGGLSPVLRTETRVREQAQRLAWSYRTRISSATFNAMFGLSSLALSLSVNHAWIRAGACGGNPLNS